MRSGRASLTDLPRLKAFVGSRTHLRSWRGAPLRASSIPICIFLGRSGGHQSPCGGAAPSGTFLRISRCAGKTPPATGCARSGAMRPCWPRSADPLAMSSINRCRKSPACGIRPARFMAEQPGDHPSGTGRRQISSSIAQMFPRGPGVSPECWGMEKDSICRGSQCGS